MTAASGAEGSPGGETRRRLMRLVPHPFLFAAFPILYLARVNLWSITWREVLPPLGITLGAVLVIHLAGRPAQGDGRRTAIALSIAALLFFSYGHVWEVLYEKELRGFVVGRDKVLVPVWGVLFVAGLLFAARTKALGGVTRLFNAVGLALVLVTALPVVVHLTSVRPASAAPALRIEGKDTDEPRSARPDIYFLVLDRYAGATTLAERFGYDNGDFLGFLEERGFSIGCGATANYQDTTKSLAATLNLRYVDWVSEQAGEDSRSLVPYYSAIRDHAVGSFLRARGYRYVHIGSWWDPTNSNPHADVNHRLDAPSGFTRALYTSSALWPAARRGFIGSVRIGREELHRSVALRQFELLRQAASMRGPKFVFAHMLLPHPPFVFASDGSLLDHDGRVALGRAGRSPYVEQLRYLNDRLEDLIRELDSGSRGRRSVVIIQADEGPFPRDVGIGRSIALRKSSDEDLRVKYRILSALRMPGADPGAVEGVKTPVNDFRVLFNEYFGKSLDMLPNRSFLSPEDRPHRHVDITDRLAESATTDAGTSDSADGGSCSLSSRVAPD